MLLIPRPMASGTAVLPLGILVFLLLLAALLGSKVAVTRRTCVLDGGFLPGSTLRPSSAREWCSPGGKLMPGSMSASLVAFRQTRPGIAQQLQTASPGICCADLGLFCLIPASGQIRLSKISSRLTGLP